MSDTWKPSVPSFLSGGWLRRWVWLCHFWNRLWRNCRLFKEICYISSIEAGLKQFREKKKMKYSLGITNSGRVVYVERNIIDQMYYVYRQSINTGCWKIMRRTLHQISYGPLIINKLILFAGRHSSKFCLIAIGVTSIYNYGVSPRIRDLGPDDEWQNFGWCILVFD